MINLKVIEQLKPISFTSTHPKVWISSAIVFRNKVISFGVNQMKSHPFQKRYSRNSEAIFFHAETSAIHIAEKRMDFNKFESSEIYIYRSKYYSSDKEKFVSGLAFPCEGCLRCIKEYGISKIIYSLDHIDGSDENFGVMLL